MTLKYYFKDMLCLETTANVVAIDAEKSSIMLDKTIFHVKGGGQLADSGTIDDVVVLNVLHDEFGNVLHQVVSDDLSKFSVNTNVRLKIDAAKRQHHSRLHSAGHVIAGIVEKLFPDLKAISGNHIPGQCRVVFSGPLQIEKEAFISAVEQELTEFLQSNSPITVRHDDANLRFIDIAGCNETACGGTHVSEIGDIGEIIIRKVSSKKGQVSISYEL